MVVLLSFLFGDVTDCPADHLADAVFSVRRAGPPPGSPYGEPMLEAGGG
jgi:hypothetical protein